MSILTSKKVIVVKNHKYSSISIVYLIRSELTGIANSKNAYNCLNSK